MTKIEKVRFRNFLQYGNAWSEFVFGDGITRVAGKNGTGKSTIFESLYFGLFGKTYRKITLGQLVNTINKKELEVEVYFTINSDSYVIQRGIKPNYMRVYKNGIDPANIIPVPSSTRSYQEVFEEDILRSTCSLFEQTSMKTLTKSISFLTLEKSHRREIIENILDTGIYTEMSDLAKIKIDKLEKEVQFVAKDMDYTDILIRQEEQNISNLERIQAERSAKTSAKVEIITQEIVNIIDENRKVMIGIQKLNQHKIKKNELTSRLKEVEHKNRDNENQLQIVINKINVVKDKVKFLQSTCGKCEKIETLVHTDNVAVLLADKNAKEQQSLADKKIIQDLNDQIAGYDKYLIHESKLTEQHKFNERSIIQKQEYIKQEQEHDIVIDRSKIEEFKAQRISLEEMYNEKVIEKKHHVYARTLLADKTIKAHIIKKYLPSINTLLNVYLQKFGSDIIFDFDEEFQVVVKSRHKETFSYYSFSEGQKRRIDLAILFMFIVFCNLKSKHANTNVLILDEIAIGLDSETETILYDILNELSVEKNKSIIVISHAINQLQNVDRIYEITNEQGFSNINAMGGV